MKKQPLILLSVFLILALLIFFNNNFPPIKFVSGVVQSIFASPKSAIYSLKTNKSDNQDVSKLKNENAALTQKLIDYDKAKRDNDALRSQFETSQDGQFSLMPARVIGFSGSFGSPDALIIDQGLASGIKQGMAVILKKDLVGKIGKVASAYSQILLPVNSGFTALAKTSDVASPGVARGLDDFILFDQVSVNDSITKGSLLLTSGEVGSNGIGIPPDMILGKITSINRSPSLPFQTAKVESEIDFSRLETVFVVVGFK